MLAAALAGFAAKTNLAILNAFDGRYNDVNGVETRIVEQPGNYYLSIEVTDNPEIVKQVAMWCEQAYQQASSTTTITGDGEKKIILIVGDGTNMGITYPTDKSSIRVWLQSTNQLLDKIKRFDF